MELTEKILEKNTGAKRVLHIMRSLDAGGIGAFIMNVYRTVDREKIQFDFAITTGGMGIFGEEILRMGGRIFFISERGNRSKLDGFGQMARLYKVCRKNKYDVVHCHYYFGNAYFLACAKLAGVPKLVSHCHNTRTQPVNFLTKCFEAVSRQILLRVGTDFLGCADAATQFLYGRKAFLSGKARTLYNGIDYDVWNVENYNIPELKRAYGLKDEKVVVFVGRMEKQKNPLYALGVMKEVHTQYPNVRAFFVGTGSYDEAVDGFIRENDMSAYVKRMPQDADIRELQAISDVMIAPSLWEGLSIAFIEAQKMNTIVVTSTLVPDEIDMGLCSFLSLDNPVEWTRCLIGIFENAAKMPITRHYADFNVKNTVRNLLDIYQDAGPASRQGQ